MNQAPTTWLGILGLLIVTIPATLAGLGAMRASRRNRHKLGDVQNGVDTVNEQMGSFQTQLVNGHKTNLRDDISEALRLMGIVKTGMENLQDNDIRLIRGDISRISGDIQVLRGELTDEREARTELDERVRRHHEIHKPPDQQ